MYNPRPGFHAVRHMNAALNMVDGELRAGAAGDCPGGRYVQLESDKGTITLVLPDAGVTELSLPVDIGPGQLIDLASGEITPVTVTNNITVIAPVLIIPG